jgi:hypothetical protein
MDHSPAPRATWVAVYAPSIQILSDFHFKSFLSRECSIDLLSNSHPNFPDQAPTLLGTRSV